MNKLEHLWKVFISKDGRKIRLVMKKKTGGLNHRNHVVLENVTPMKSLEFADRAKNAGTT